MKYPPRCTAFLTATVLASALATGCMIDDDASQLGPRPRTRTRSTRTRSTRTPSMAAVWTGLALAPLTSDHLSDTSSRPSTTRHDPEDGHDGQRLREQTLTYVYSCAMPADATMTVVTPGGRSFDYKGALGVAPGWGQAPIQSKTGASARPPGRPCCSARYQPGQCGQDCQQWVSACVIARINAFGVKVQISMAGRQPGAEPQRHRESDRSPSRRARSSATSWSILRSCTPARARAWSADWQLIDGSVAAVRLPPCAHLRPRQHQPVPDRLPGYCSENVTCGPDNIYGYYNRCQAPDGTWYSQVATTYMPTPISTT